ncbi:MoaF C-terminal domain-containing protein [Amycolatopsis sp. FDAARGOS 1241]|uniref:MoaF C-terminal domain-containing protein n=1 Tax=Amycolatopsis sp. FDAARGOS 1241 TaxID=2778070 RepID=UPI00194E3F00|nr:MoaF C-terminal domain-containing protein [Amycolatopsis sp. FDAARGOS 1241]QRP50441.1 MoaF N-terminal domain-containing protein [Amycolatopsis sp. FDAARGOS 1241]
MTTDSLDFSDTRAWPSLDRLAPGFDGYKAATSSSVAGREIVFTNSQGSWVSHRFGTTTVEWSYEPGADDPHPVVSGRDDYEAFDVAEGLVYTQFHHREDVPDTAVSLVLDFDRGRSLAVVSTIGAASEDRTRVRHTFLPGHIEGLEPREPEPAPTTALVGRRVRWAYSAEHSYEHVYVGPHSYNWRCLAGPAAGLAGTEECTTYRIRPGIYVFTSREKVIPCASVTIADLRDTASPRSYGAVFGLDETGESPTHFTFGAVGELLGHPVQEHDPS